LKTEVLSETIKSSETLKTIYERRAIRKYKDKPVDNAIIGEILDAGRMAPPAINKQPWKFYILTLFFTASILILEIFTNYKIYSRILYYS